MSKQFVAKLVKYEGFIYDGDLMSSDGNYYVPDWAVEAYQTGVLKYIAMGTTVPDLFIIQHDDCQLVMPGDAIIRTPHGLCCIRKCIIPLLFEVNEEGEEK